MRKPPRATGNHANAVLWAPKWLFGSPETPLSAARMARGFASVHRFDIRAQSRYCHGLPCNPVFGPIPGIGADIAVPNFGV